MNPNTKKNRPGSFHLGLLPRIIIAIALGILSSMLGFGDNDLALMIALYIAMDSFGTACNVTGDGAIALIVDKLFGKKDNE